MDNAPVKRAELEQAVATMHAHPTDSVRVLVRAARQLLAHRCPTLTDHGARCLAAHYAAPPKHCDISSSETRN